MILTTLVALLFLQSSVASPRQPVTRNTRASIEGVVFGAGAGEPLPRAQVTLVRITADSVASPADPPSSPSTSPTVTTDADGRFFMGNVEPGSYRIAVARNGYARQEYGQRVFGGPGRAIALAAGQRMTGLAFNLTPAGAVTGVVRDSAGEPVVGARVQLLRSSYNGSGQRTLRAAGGDRTNDRGEYRVYWVTPGRYYVAVSGAVSGRAVPMLDGVGSPNEFVDRRYPTSYYPGTTDVSQASIVDVPPGGEVTTVDVVVTEQELFRVSGRIVDPLSGRHPATASVSVVSRGTTGTTMGVSGATASFNAADGSFDLRDVAAGSYWLRAISAPGSADMIVPSSAAGRTVADVFVDSLFAGREVAQLALDVTGDVVGLVLTFSSGVAVKGLVSVENQPLSAVAGLERLEVTLKPDTAGMLTNPTRHEPLRPDGLFTLENVLPGEYAVTVNRLPPGYYLKDVQFGKVRALDRPLVVSGPVPALLNVVLSPNSGQIEGVIVDARRQPVSGVEAVLVPDRRPARVDLYKTAVTDPSGRFAMRGIPPGDYKVFAWEAIESFAYFDEYLIRQFDQSGTRVRIAESSREQVEVTVIPARFP
jgi:Carboxypeptidase regulatory-like domain